MAQKNTVSQETLGTSCVEIADFVPITKALFAQDKGTNKKGECFEKGLLTQQEKIKFNVHIEEEKMDTVQKK